MHRYLVLIWDSADTHTAKHVTAVETTLLSAARPWVIAYRNERISVIHLPIHKQFSHIYPLANLHGIVLGSLFQRSAEAGRGDQNVKFCAHETKQILRTSGRHLVERYWGSYVAIVHDQISSSCSILRDPTGNLSCYHVQLPGLHVFFSDVRDFAKYFPDSLSVDWSYMAARLFVGCQLSRRCSIKEIEDVPGGEWITLSREGERRVILWHPAKFCLEDGLENQQKAIRELRSTVHNVVSTLASGHTHLLVRLSGGLDSSIVTSCLSGQIDGPDVNCLNFYVKTNSDDAYNSPLPQGFNQENLAKLRRIAGSADERYFARSVARKFGFNLFEHEKRVDRFDFRKLWHAPLSARPTNYAFTLDESDPESECLSECRASACFTGQAGDTVFYCTFRAIGALDYAYLHPLGRDIFHQIALTVTLSGESLARVVGKVIRHGVFRIPLPSPFEPIKQPHLLSDEIATESATAYFHHPWMEFAQRLCPGKYNHVIGVSTSVPSYHYPRHCEPIAPSINPLAAQPVVETCLRIPTYVLLADGVSRGLARRAFEDLLPPQVARRTTKGIATAFWMRLVRKNLQFLKESLLNGILTQQGLLDPIKLEKYLTIDQPFYTIQPQKILDYLACEAWARQWHAS